MLLSDECKAVLIAIRVLHRFDVEHIESRNAQIRRCSAFQQTSDVDVQRLSAFFSLQRSRLISERFVLPGAQSSATMSSTTAKRIIKTGKQKGYRTHGGGVQRAFFSEWLPANRPPGKLDKEARADLFRRGIAAFPVNAVQTIHVSPPAHDIAAKVLLLQGAGGRQQDLIDVWHGLHIIQRAIPSRVCRQVRDA